MVPLGKVSSAEKRAISAMAQSILGISRDSGQSVARRYSASSKVEAGGFTKPMGILKRRCDAKLFGIKGICNTPRELAKSPLPRGRRRGYDCARIRLALPFYGSSQFPVGECQENRLARRRRELENLCASAPPREKHPLKTAKNPFYEPRGHPYHGLHLLDARHAAAPCHPA